MDEINSKRYFPKNGELTVKLGNKKVGEVTFKQEIGTAAIVADSVNLVAAPVLDSVKVVGYGAKTILSSAADIYRGKGLSERTIDFDKKGTEALTDLIGMNEKPNVQRSSASASSASASDTVDIQINGFTVKAAKQKPVDACFLPTMS